MLTLRYLRTRALNGPRPDCFGGHPITLAQAVLAARVSPVYLLVVDSERPLPPSFQQHLMPTQRDEVSEESVAALRRFCETSSEVEAGYICAVESDLGGQVPRRLTFMVKIASPVSERDDVGELPRIFVQRLAEASPDLLREFSCGVLADRAIAAYEKNGLRIFSR